MIDDYLQDLIYEQIGTIMEECSNDVVGVICKRIKEIGTISDTDAIRLVNLSRTKDLAEIKKIIATATDRSIKEVDSIIGEVAKRNDDLAEKFYKATGTPQITLDNVTLMAIRRRAMKTIKESIVNLSETSAFYLDGKRTKISDAYVKSVNKAIFATQQGLTDYNTAIRGTVKSLADSGLTVVDYASGYHRRLDSAVRMNVLDGMRQMNIEYREIQGEEFGADGVEITAHGNPAPDHAGIQGRQFTKKAFERMNSQLARPIGTMNCMHTTFPIILGILEPAYSENQLQNMEQKANEIVEYAGKNGDILTCNRYEATQKQRQQETILRRLKDERNAYLNSGDEFTAKEINKRIRAQSAYYKRMSEELGLRPKMERTRVVQ